jgi:nucleoside-diphosphate-sugar epimerase
MNDLTATRVLVTGGAGFLGSHLCERRLAEGLDVLCVDNFYTGRKHNVAHLLGEPRFELLRHELTGSRSQIVLAPLPQDDPVQRRPDIGLARRVLDWAPVVRLEEGLAKTIAYFDGLLRDNMPAMRAAVELRRNAAAR